VSTEDLALLRQGVYRLGGAGFAPPRPDSAGRVSGSIPVLADLGLFDYAFSLALVDYLETLASADHGALVTAFMALFEVGVGGASCPPTESAWLANPYTGDSAVIHSELGRAYVRYGLRPAGPMADTIDHVAVELEVMASLCAAEVAQRRSNGSSARTVGYQREFLDLHLGRWIPGFAEAVVRADRHPVYTALARAIHAFVTHDRELLAVLAGAEEGQR